MAVIEISHEIRHGNCYVYVTSEKGTHHSTVASAAYHYVRELKQPDYVINPLRGNTKAGKWCMPTYRGVWAAIHSTRIEVDRKFFESWPVPA